MTYDQIVALALDITHTKSSQVSPSKLKSYFNIARKELANALVKDVNENYFFQIWKRDAIADQNNGEYPYPEADHNSSGMVKLERLAIKMFSTDTDYTPAVEVNPKRLHNDWSWYLKNQPKNKPIYFVADESIFIAPQFAAADLPASPSGNQQIKLYGIAKITDLETGASDAAILIPDDSHHRIAIGMQQWIYRSRAKKREAIEAKQEFEIAKSEMIDELTNRDNSEMRARLPDDYNLGFGEASQASYG